MGWRLRFDKVIEHTKKYEVYFEKNFYQNNLTIRNTNIVLQISKKCNIQKHQRITNIFKLFIKISKKVLHAKRMLKDFLEFNCRGVGMRTYQVESFRKTDKQREMTSILETGEYVKK